MATKTSGKEKKINVAKAVTAQLHTTEEAIDQALIEAANLVETCVSSRRAVHLSTTQGQKVHHSTLMAMKALADAQTHMSDAHEELNALKDSMGLTALIPPVFDKPFASQKSSVTA